MERWNGLAIVPAVLTFTYPLWPPAAYDSLWLALIPQFAAYACLAVWCAVNDRRFDRLFLVSHNLKKSLLLGGFVGFLTGPLNLWVIVNLTPWLGYSFEFLRDTPHSRMPFSFMVPWGIVLIAFFVEISFRGFLLGRLLVFFGERSYGPAAAVVLSASVFSFDPFMVTVFRGYHWLALTDGLIWGGLLIYTRNLFSTIAAHAVEVILVYTVLRVFYA
ncbi:MAG TPA: CPBP family glutamic-type intramembrane protease [Nitrospiria bacterium]